MYLIRTNSLGKEVWSKTYGGKDFEYGESMDLAPNGELYLAGTTKSYGRKRSPDMWVLKVRPNGDRVWDKTAGGPNSDYGHCVKTMKDGGCAILGDTQSLGAGKRDFFLVRFTPNGKFISPPQSK